MNIKEIILDELKDKDWSKLTIARYIYIRTCELLTFNLLYNFGDSGIKEKIENKDVDINHLESSKVICKQWAYIYQELLKEVEIESSIEGNEKHKFVTIYIDDMKIVADPTFKYYSDMVRVKYGDYTTGFFDYEKHVNDAALRKIDEEIGYIKGIYTSEVIKMLMNEFDNEKLLEETLGITDDMSFYDKLKIKFEFICSIVNNSKAFNKDYVDTVNYLGYLMKTLLGAGEYISITEIIYYLENETNLDIETVSIFKIKDYEKDHYYLLSKKEDLFGIEKMNEEEMEFYNKEYKMKRKMISI